MTSLYCSCFHGCRHKTLSSQRKIPSASIRYYTRTENYPLGSFRRCQMQGFSITRRSLFSILPRCIISGLPLKRLLRKFEAFCNLHVLGLQEGWRNWCFYRCFGIVGLFCHRRSLWDQHIASKTQSLQHFFFVFHPQIIVPCFFFFFIYLVNTTDLDGSK